MGNPTKHATSEMEYHLVGVLSTMGGSSHQSLTSLASLQSLLILPLQNSAAEENCSKAQHYEIDLCERTESI